MSTGAGAIRRFAGRVKRRLVGWGDRLRQWARWTTVGAIGTLTVLMYAFPQGHSTFPVLVGWLAVLSAFALPAAFLMFLAGLLLRVGLFSDAHVRVEDAELVIEAQGQARRHPLTQFASGIVVPRGSAADVHLRMLNDNEVVIRLEDSALADALLDALGLGATRRRTDVGWTPLGSTAILAWLSMTVSWIPLFVASQAAKGTPWALALTPSLLCAPWLVVGAVVRLRKREVVVGQDGVRAKLGPRKLSLSFGDVASVERQGSLITFTLRDGRHATLLVARTRGGAQLAAALETRIEAAREAFASAVGGAPARFLREDGVPFAAWVTELKQALAHEGSFRAAPMRPEEALRVVEDPKAPAEARVGAAIALAAHGSEQDRLRVRVATESTVRPRIRVALRQALLGEVEQDTVNAAEDEHTRTS